MKTKILIIASLFLAGMIFTSCQKDNSFQPSETISVPNPPSDQVGQDYEFHPGDVFNLTPLDGDPDPGGIGNDMITNVPDPFRNYTAIFYQVSGSNEIVGGKWVSLMVYNQKSELVSALIRNKFQRPGRYEVKFDASKLPYGRYTAELTISSETLSVVYREKMTKKKIWDEDNHSPIED